MRLFFSENNLNGQVDPSHGDVPNDTSSITAEHIQADTPLYNSRIIASFVSFIRKYYQHIDVKELLQYSKMAPYQVDDDNQWFTQEQVDLFHSRLVTLTKNTNIAREAGRYAVSTDSLGVIKSYALGFVNPMKVCEMIKKATLNIVKSCNWEATRLGQNKMEITVTPKPGTNEKPYQCENRIGYIESIFTLFKHKLPKIEHTECVFRGDACCRYIITWHTFRADFWRKIRYYFTLALAIAAAVLIIFSTTAILIISLALSLCALFALSYKILHLEREELLAAVQNLSISTDTLFEKLDASTKNARLIHEVGLTLAKQRHIDGILKDVASILAIRLDYDRGMILLADKENKTLGFKAGFGYSDDQQASLEKAVFRLRPDSKGILVSCFRERRPFLINDIDEVKNTLSTHSLAFAEEMGVKSFICCPIICVDDVIGVLAFDNVNTKRPLLQSDLDLLMALSPEIGISIQNAMVTDLKERQFNSILEVLASSIDARDSLTALHSKRVTRFAMGISAELKLKKDYCEVIRVASLLHDYGKIGVRESILEKPGSLSPVEYEEIKTHALKTKQILEKVEFEGIFKKVPEIAASHHEKWDGSGYPNGLKGTEIPLGARILAVADVFEAITSKRHYRDPMHPSEALEIIKSGKNKHFDASIVDAFIRYYQKKGQQADSLQETEPIMTDVA